MAIRTNHNKNSGGGMVKTIIGILILGGFFLFKQFTGIDLNSADNKATQEASSKPITLPTLPNSSKITTKDGTELGREKAVEPVETTQTKPSSATSKTNTQTNTAALPAGFNKFKDFIPAISGNVKPIAHKTYALGYVEAAEQASWVAYELTVADMKRNNGRIKQFQKDPLISTGSSHPDDYNRNSPGNNSKYNRGHLLPSADRSYSKDAMKEVYLMSNISPQAYDFNGGIWRELEELVRDWAYYYKRLYIVTGPDLSDNLTQKMGKYNKITIPKNFYKVIYAPDAKGIRAIGFYMPNEETDRPVTDFMMTIDEVEEKTGLDFFPHLEDQLENQIEADFTKSDWKFDARKEKKRIEVWNNYN